MANDLAAATPAAAADAAAKVEDAESMPYKTASERFHRLFNVGADEKLVSYYSCCLLGGGIPAQERNAMRLSMWHCLTLYHVQPFSEVRKSTEALNLTLPGMDVLDGEPPRVLLVRLGPRKEGTAEVDRHHLD